MDRTRKKIYFDLQKLSFRRCLEPSGQCGGAPIRAHSIQNARILEMLSSNGHVIMPQLTHTGGVPDITFARIGRNQATTFLGLCGQHDQEIFRPIERVAIDVEDDSHLFLLAYRAVFRETHACIQAAVKMQAGYQARVTEGLSPADRPDRAGLMATEWLANSYDTYKYKRKFDTAYLKRDYQRLGHFRLVFDDAPPSVAASALFSLDDVDWPDDVARVALNVFPEPTRTHVILSFLKEEKPYATQYLQRILDATGHYQRYLVSKLVLQHCENFVMSPSYFEGMAHEQKDAVREFFLRTLNQNEHDYEDQNLYLF